MGGFSSLDFFDCPTCTVQPWVSPPKNLACREDQLTSSFPAVDGYAILRQPPATGRTARVYRAVSLESGAPAAIKMLTASVEPSTFLDEAFKRETTALGELKHPHIVKMFSSGTAGTGEKFIVLEWMESDLLKWKERNSGFEWGSFWETIGRPLTAATAYAHSRNIVHRDLAPRNILFSDDGTPKVADFGVSKLRRFLRSERTLREFVSPPFTPKESDDGSGSFTRDVFALATLFVWAASPRPLATYEDVGRFASATDAFEGSLRECLLSALSDDPDERPATAEQLLHQIERLRSSVSSRKRPALSCQLNLHEQKADAIARSFGLSDRRDVEDAILDDLNAVCGLKPMPPLPTEASDDRVDLLNNLQLLGLTFSYHARVDVRGQDRLVILGARETPSGLLDRQRESALVVPIDFRFAPRGRQADRQAIAELQHLLSDHLASLDQASEDDIETRLFDMWSRILQAKQDVEASRERPIHYVRFSLDGQRVTFKTYGPIPAEVMHEPRQVRLNDGSFLTGHVEAVQGDEVTFYVSAGDVGQLRPTGDIVFSVYASSEALRRQQRALDAFRQKNVALPRLANVLTEPEIAQQPGDVSIAKFFQEDLDADKQKAIQTVIGAPEVVLLKGPPGTGKTTFIAELILQTLERSSDARILLCSQTNVAIDNAIERLTELGPLASRSIEVVRLGTNDEKIAVSVEPFRLTSRLQAWTKEVTARVDNYIQNEASRLNLDHRNVAIGILLEKLLATYQELSQLNERLREEERSLERMRERGATEIEDQRIDLDVAGSVNARRLEIARIRDLIRQTNEVHNLTKQELTALGGEAEELATAPPAHLKDFIDLYFDGPGDVEHLKSLMNLGADWTARFGRQDHFEAPFLSMADVVAGTCVGIVGPRSAADLAFDLCIVDEASKATATEVLVPLSRAKKWLLVGDSKQLPPFQDEALRDKEILERYDLRREEVAESLFGYLERRLPKNCITALTVQHRMIAPISDMIAHCFYPDQTLECGREDNGRSFSPVLPAPVTWLDTSKLPSRGETESDTGVSNRLECELIRTRLQALNRRLARLDRKKEAKKVSVAVLTGYAEQRNLLERTLNPLSHKWTHINILLNTVDAFQGRQADMAIYSVTRSNDSGYLGFLNQSPRLNVALSRGRDALLIVGDKKFCSGINGENPFREVIDWIDWNTQCMVEVAAK
ncbi:AAA domain-containing protein [Bradyrhizobium stylosanthis]|uniref:AAA domain-containing protein n=1 Tax=Bradyrhizobium stylosanthis TaxID=1803665 RepID=UPI001FD9B151|nr:AAA domain-containing protein [Bradyrhizobium stylosanthis]